jgi:hypothetical protein
MVVVILPKARQMRLIVLIRIVGVSYQQQQNVLALFILVETIGTFSLGSDRSWDWLNGAAVSHLPKIEKQCKHIPVGK